MSSTIIQGAIAVLSLTAVCLTQSTNAKHQRYACLFGLASQPFWLYSTLVADQWGMFFLSVLYTVVWASSARRHWLGRAAP